MRDYDLKVLRDNVAMVLQKNVLFSGTIKENMRWGNPNATDEEIMEACKLAQADEFIQLMPNKYDTYIEQGGMKNRCFDSTSILREDSTYNSNHYFAARFKYSGCRSNFGY